MDLYSKNKVANFEYIASFANFLLPMAFKQFTDLNLHYHLAFGFPYSKTHSLLNLILYRCLLDSDYTPFINLKYLYLASRTFYLLTNLVIFNLFRFC